MADLDLLSGEPGASVPVSHAFWEFLYWAQTVKAAAKLSMCLDCMNIPVYRKTVGEVHHLQWLDRNMHIYNDSHYLYPEARRLLTLLFNESRYRVLKWDWWRTV